VTILTIIVARSTNHVIGKDNKLLWNIPEDMSHFKTYTMGKPIIMGRKTFESIGRALPGRLNVVVSRNRFYEAKGTLVASSLKMALQLVGNVPEAVLIGGGDLYVQALREDLVEQCIVTEVHAKYEGDTYFPRLKKSKWEVTRVQKSIPCKGFTITKYVRRP
jgi:dihydrofolate reductase